MAIRWLIRTFTCFLLVLGCWGLAGCGGAAKKPSEGATTAAPSGPPGGPAPAELIGTWTRVVPTDDDSDDALTFDANHYRIVDGPPAAQGEIVVDGTEIYLMNVPNAVPGCQRVGHYQWRLRGATLHFTPLDDDPCPLRHDRFANQDYTKGAG